MHNKIILTLLFCYVALFIFIILCAEGIIPLGRWYCMYTNRIDTAGNPIYEEVDSFEVIFCPYCGAMNKISLD